MVVPSVQEAYEPSENSDEVSESEGESGPPSARGVLTEESLWSLRKFRKVHSARMYQIDARLKNTEDTTKQFTKKVIGFVRNVYQR